MPGQRAPEEARREQIVSAAYEVALRMGIHGITLRAVAAEAELSHGLVVFYFKRKEQLIAALLDRVLTTTALLHLPDDVAEILQAGGRIGALLRQESGRVVQEPHGIRLFFEYWALGVRQVTIRRRIGAALERYRAAFRAMAEEMLPSESAEGSSVSLDALAAVAVSLVSGYAMQAMIDPSHFDSAAYLTAAEELIERLVQPAA